MPTTDLTSLATRSTISGSSPYSRLPISASPEIFSRTRPYRALVGIAPSIAAITSNPQKQLPTTCYGRNRSDRSGGDNSLPSLAADIRLCGDFSGKVGLLLFDAFAQDEPGKADDLDRRADFLGDGLDDLAYLVLAVDHIDLFEQYDFFI